MAKHLVIRKHTNLKASYVESMLELDGDSANRYL